MFRAHEHALPTTWQHHYTRRTPPYTLSSTYFISHALYTHTHSLLLVGAVTMPTHLHTQYTTVSQLYTTHNAQSCCSGHLSSVLSVLQCLKHSTSNSLHHQLSPRKCQEQCQSIWTRCEKASVKSGQGEQEKAQGRRWWRHHYPSSSYSAAAADTDALHTHVILSVIVSSIIVNLSRVYSCEQYDWIPLTKFSTTVKVAFILHILTSLTVLDLHKFFKT